MRNYCLFLLTILLLSPKVFAADERRSSPDDFHQKKNVTSTIVLSKPGTYDFGNVLHVWKGKGSCNQKENQPYILRIAASDVTIKNFAYMNAPDGIHIGTANDGQGHSSGSPISNITLQNVTGWACEDALTTQYGVKDVKIIDSKFHGNPNSNFRDKILQLNFGAAISILNTSFFDTITCVNLRGGIKAFLSGNYFEGCSTAIRGSTIEGYKGKMKKDPITISSEKNIFVGTESGWDQPELIRADGKVSGTSSADVVKNGVRVKNEKGATVKTLD